MPIQQIRSLVEHLNSHPIAGLSLSAGGLLALADLQTIAQRTAITGGSSWLDALVLAPGLHYQQAADSLAREGPGVENQAVERHEQGQVRQYPINNAATLNYLQRTASSSTSRIVTVDVVGLGNAADDDDATGKRTAAVRRRRRRQTRRERDLFPDEGANMDWISHLLYLATPVFTVIAITLTVLLEDWWALGFILALMLSRILNIFVIKQRTKVVPRQPQLPPQPPQAQDPEQRRHMHVDDKLTEYYVDVGRGTIVRLCGMASDLHAITSESWMKNKTYVEGYLEAMAKLIVYLVASLSGNMTQAGAIVLMCLLLISAGLLALSNSHSKGFSMHGRVAKRRPDVPSLPEDGHDGHGLGLPYPSSTGSWPSGSSEPEASSALAGEYGKGIDWAEKGQVGHRVPTAYPFQDSFDFS